MNTKNKSCSDFLIAVPCRSLGEDWWLKFVSFFQLAKCFEQEATEFYCAARV
jgi:N-glycosylase/DNA lyase